MILLVESRTPNWVDKSMRPVNPKKAEPIMGRVFVLMALAWLYKKFKPS